METLTLTNPWHRKRRRRKNPLSLNPMTKKQKTGLTIALAAAAGLAAFFLFGKKAKAEPAGTLDPGPVTPPDEDDEIPDPEPAPPKGKLVDVTWDAESQAAIGNIATFTLQVWHARPRIVEGVDFGQSVKSRGDIASAAFVKTFAASPTVKKWPGRRIPAKSDVAPGQIADWEKYVSAWKQARTRVGGLHNDYRTSIFISKPGCLVVEIGSKFYNVNHSFITTGVLQGKPASQIAEDLWKIAEDVEMKGIGPCSATFAVNTAKKVMAQKFIDEFGAKP